MSDSVFIIEGTLPGMNDIIAEAKKNRFAYSVFKKEWDGFVSAFILKDKIPVFQYPVEMHISWYEKHNRRDYDNISGGGTKFIMDSLVKTGRLQNDNKRWVKAITHAFKEADKENPRVVVSIREYKTLTYGAS